MAKQQQRKFGTVPEASKTGPVSLLNYHFRAEMHCAGKGKDRADNHPTLTRDAPDFHTWQQYFEQHLGGRPIGFRMLMAGEISELTVPEQVPQWFDPSFEPDPKWRSAWPAFTLRDMPPGRLFSVLVRTNAPQYAAMLDRGESYPQPSRWWRMDPDGRGVWVPFGWLDEAKPMRGMQSLGAHARVAAQ